MPTSVPGTSLIISAQATLLRSLPISAAPAAMPISVHAGTSTLSGMHEAEQRHRRRGAEARRAARRIGDHHHHAAVDDRQGGEGFDGGTPDLFKICRVTLCACRTVVAAFPAPFPRPKDRLRILPGTGPMWGRKIRRRGKLSCPDVNDAGLLRLPRRSHSPSPDA